MLKADKFIKLRMIILAIAMCTTSFGIFAAETSRPHVFYQMEESTTDLKIHVLNDRLKILEDEKLADRLTRLETYQEGNHWLLTTIAGGVILMVLEAGIRVVRRK